MRTVDPSGGNPRHEPRRFEELFGAVWAFSTLMFAVKVVCLKLFLIYLYGWSQVQHEQLRFLSTPHSHPWKVSNGDLIADGTSVCFAISLVCWIAMFLATYPFLRLLLPAKRPQSRNVGHWIVQKQAQLRDASELTSEEARIAEECRRAGAWLSITDSGWFIQAGSDASVAVACGELARCQADLIVGLFGETSDEAFRLLAPIANKIIALTLGSRRITAGGIAELSQFPRLSTLTVAELGESTSLAEFADCLAALPRIEHLTFARPIDDEVFLQRVKLLANPSLILIDGKLVKGPTGFPTG